MAYLRATASQDLFDLTGRAALVTGASRGIGFSTALALAEAGAHVAVCSRRKNSLRSIVKEVEKLGQKGIAIQADVSDRTQVQSMVSRAVRALGRIDILVNSAGTILRKPALEWTGTEWNHVLDVNLKGTFLCCQEVAKRMIERKETGKIINIASLLSAIGVPNIIAYAGSKGGVASLTRSLAVEWAKYRINVNAIGPGYIRTELTKPLQENRKHSAYIVSRIPLKRWGEADDLKGTVVFLASRASDYVTGQIIWVDGGWTAA
jgi:2-deoxy-D-gluconate 3-dehydrogenase